ncbi:hypothetical protein DWU89_10995 [Parabacteroides acidifaciens]|uniref:Uncharacterized protein n=1 Tax=Parabacteroides acidifaciens TaxID=2290935 RepID=A0A3D8HDQ7_9BACT|nr:hypothetical protein DWU89_10995 [Parabacteroides acidifaciens]
MVLNVIIGNKNKNKNESPRAPVPYFSAPVPYFFGQGRFFFGREQKKRVKATHHRGSYFMFNRSLAVNNQKEPIIILHV